MGFSKCLFPLQNFSILSLDKIFFANVVEKTIRTLRKRAKFPAAGDWGESKCP
jgi:hypothetical protein